MKFNDTYIGNERMFLRIGTCHVYPRNDATREAVCQLEWAYGVLDKPNALYQNGRESHECANEVIEQHEDTLLDHLCIRA